MTTDHYGHSIAVLDVRGLSFASEQNVVEAVLLRLAGAQVIEDHPQDAVSAGRRGGTHRTRPSSGFAVTVI